jgi:hypothetical protein
MNRNRNHRKIFLILVSIPSPKKGITSTQTPPKTFSPSHKVHEEQQQNFYRTFANKDIGNVIMKTLNVSVNVIGEAMLLRKMSQVEGFWDSARGFYD